MQSARVHYAFFKSFSNIFYQYTFTLYRVAHRGWDCKDDLYRQIWRSQIWINFFALGVVFKKLIIWERNEETFMVEGNHEHKETESIIFCTVVSEVWSCRLYNIQTWSGSLVRDILYFHRNIPVVIFYLLYLAMIVHILPGPILVHIWNQGLWKHRLRYHIQFPVFRSYTDNPSV